MGFLRDSRCLERFPVPKKVIKNGLAMNIAASFTRFTGPGALLFFSIIRVANMLAHYFVQPLFTFRLLLWLNLRRAKWLNRKIRPKKHHIGFTIYQRNKKISTHPRFGRSGTGIIEVGSGWSGSRHNEDKRPLKY